ncbi:MAG: helix-turn-helix domain-containing protein, partial [Thermodesulfobacteriota bacterium]|nr:helix-turn-helix domain-containing protein [Thermodesulfobacteriota bacterium]
LLKGLITEDLQVHEILLHLEKESHSITELAQKLKLAPSLVLQHISALRRRRLVDLQEIKAGVPFYTLVPVEDRKQTNEC